MSSPSFLRETFASSSKSSKSPAERPRTVNRSNKSPAERLHPVNGPSIDSSPCLGGLFEISGSPVNSDYRTASKKTKSGCSTYYQTPSRTSTGNSSEGNILSSREDHSLDSSSESPNNNNFTLTHTLTRRNNPLERDEVGDLKEEEQQYNTLGRKQPGLTEKNLNVEGGSLRRPASNKTPSKGLQLPTMVDYDTAWHRTRKGLNINTHNSIKPKHNLSMHERVDALEMYTQGNMQTLFDSHCKMVVYVQEMYKDVLERQSELTSRMRVLELNAKKENKNDKQLERLQSLVEELDGSVNEVIERTKEQDTRISLVSQVSNQVSKRMEQTAVEGQESRTVTQQTVETVLKMIESVESSLNQVWDQVKGLQKGQLHEKRECEAAIKVALEDLKKELSRIETTFKADVWYLDDVISEVEEGLKWVVSQVVSDEANDSETSGSVYDSE